AKQRQEIANLKPQIAVVEEQIVAKREEKTMNQSQIDKDESALKDLIATNKWTSNASSIIDFQEANAAAQAKCQIANTGQMQMEDQRQQAFDALNTALLDDVTVTEDAIQRIANIVHDMEKIDKLTGNKTKNKHDAIMELIKSPISVSVTSIINGIKSLINAAHDKKVLKHTRQDLEKQITALQNDLATLSQL